MIDRYSRPEMTAVWGPEARIGHILEVEVALLEVIAKEKKIPRREIAILKRLLNAGPYAKAVAEKEKKSAHDVVALLQVITERLKGKAPKVVQYLHYGLTSSDVVDTATALQIRAAADLLESGWRNAIAAIKTQAKRHQNTWMVGRTHGVHAEPIPFGLKLAGWHAEARRSLQRLQAARAQLLYGKLSGAVGTYAHHSPAIESAVLRKLGLRAESIATQVIPRDRYAEFFSALALSAAAIERFATEIRHMQRTEVREVEEPFGKGQKGSSAMPHKRNPVLCENLCGLARIVRGFTVPALENVALWHERDISHSSAERIALPDATILLDFMLARFTRVVTDLIVYPDAMTRNLESSHGLVFSQKILLALIDHGLGRLAAYDIVQRNAMKTWRTGEPLRMHLSQDADVQAVMSQRELDRCFDLKAYGRQVRGVLKREGIL
jgi:adenylosuccinate lyase